LLRLLGNPRYANIREECEPAPIEPDIFDFPCMYCPKEFSSEKLLKQHMHKCKHQEQEEPEAFVPEPEFPCSTCELVFTTNKLLKVCA